MFQSLATADFTSIVREMEEVVRATASDSATTVETSDDSYGFSWLILRGSDFDDLVVGINAVSGALQAGGYGDRAAVLGVRLPGRPRHPRPLYWIYNYKRGFFYPFVPAGRAGAARQRARTGAQGPGGQRASRRNRALPVVPALGDPHLSRV